jgi:hypothetical protein
LQSLVLFGKENVREVVENATRLANVEKGITGKADIDKCCLHSG